MFKRLCLIALSATALTTLTACVVVQNREEMVVVSGGIDPRPLAALLDSPRVPRLPVLLTSR